MTLAVQIWVAELKQEARRRHGQQEEGVQLPHLLRGARGRGPRPALPPRVLPGLHPALAAG